MLDAVLPTGGYADLAFTDEMRPPLACTSAMTESAGCGLRMMLSGVVGCPL